MSNIINRSARIIGVIAIILALSLASGCADDTARGIEKLRGTEFSSQEIRIQPAGESDPTVIWNETDDPEETDVFISRLTEDMGGWSLATLPRDAREQGSITTLKRPTVNCLIFCARSALAEDSSKPMRTQATIDVYRDLPYVVLSFADVDYSLTFRVPESTADYLHGLMES